MKPLRGKREGPSGRRNAFSRAAQHARVDLADAHAPLSAERVRRRGALAVGERHDRRAAGQKPRTKVSLASAGALQGPGGTAR